MSDEEPRNLDDDAVVIPFPRRAKTWLADISPMWKLVGILVAILSGGVTAGVALARYKGVVAAVAALQQRQQRQAGTVDVIVRHIMLDERDRDWSMPVQRDIAEKLGVSTMPMPLRKSILDEIKSAPPPDEE